MLHRTLFQTQPLLKGCMVHGPGMGIMEFSYVHLDWAPVTAKNSAKTLLACEG